MSQNTFFTSDLHFGHSNVINYSNRPFSSVEEMDQILVSNWNDVVTNKDRVIIAGDLAMRYSSDYAYNIVKKLKGQKHLVFGNHDKAIRKNKEFLALFESVSDLLTVKVQDEEAIGGVRRIVICHYPMLVWDRSHYGAWHLHGHSHGSLPDDENSLRFDIGVDAWTTDGKKLYRPIEYKEIKEKMKLKKWIPKDRHGRE
jgi:calcineurin-like phosphoesterase family protein